MRKVKYLIYPSIIDSYTQFLKSDEIYDKYWGNSDNPSKTFEEFHEEQFNKFIDKINRVPVKWEDSELMDRGTAFNEIVDCIIENRKSETMNITSDKQRGVIVAEFNKRTFEFPVSVCREFANYFKGAQTQVMVSAVLPTRYGDVELYGYIDELMPTCVHDIKTTGSYEAWKYKDYMQRLVYPYCLTESGCDVDGFEFNILVIKTTKEGTTYESLTEFHSYNHEEDKVILRGKVEELIEFLEENRSKITNKKIFNEHGE